jgi:hypothetical protein
VAAELCDPVVEELEGALETEGEEGDEALGIAAGAEEEEEEDGEDALGVTAGAEEEGEKGEDALGVTEGALVTEEEVGDDALGVTAGAVVTEEEEGEDTPGFTKGALDLTYRENILGVGAIEVDGARVAVGAGVTDALGDPSVYVTFLTTACSVSQKMELA